MIVHLAILNVRRNLRRLAATGVAIAVIFAVLLVGNAILTSSRERFRRTYVDHFSGEWVVRDSAADGFTIFGSEALLVGEYHTPPTIIEGPEVLRRLLSEADVSHAVGLVSSVAQVKVAGVSANRILFGVDFASYLAAFPGVQVVRGAAPEAGDSGVFLQESHYVDLSSRLGYEPAIGSTVLVTTATGASFTIRGVPLLGTIRYPITDTVTQRVNLVDASTARALNGHVYANAAPPSSETGDDPGGGLLSGDLDGFFDAPSGPADEASADEAPPDTDGGLFDDDLGGLFDTSREEDDVAEGGPDSVSLDDIELLFSEERPEGTPSSRDPVEGAWNFVLVRSASRTPPLSGAALGDAYAVVDWRGAVGGAARLAAFVQSAMNAGLVFVVIAAVAVTANAIALSVLERGREIGTLRALGARRERVALMILLEVAVFVVVSAAIGIVLGGVATALVNTRSPQLTNPLFRQVFGDSALSATLSARLVLGHLGFAFLVAVLAGVVPLRRVLAVSPLRAMVGEYHDG